MLKLENNDLTVEMKIKAIELLGSSLNTPTNLNGEQFNYQVNIQIDTKGDASQKVLFTVVTVKIENEDQSLLYGAVTVSSVFEIMNFEQVI